MTVLAWLVNDRPQSPVASHVCGQAIRKTVRGWGSPRALGGPGLGAQHVDVPGAEALVERGGGNGAAGQAQQSLVGKLPEPFVPGLVAEVVSFPAHSRRDPDRFISLSSLFVKAGQVHRNGDGCSGHALLTCIRINSLLPAQELEAARRQRQPSLRRQWRPASQRSPSSRRGPPASARWRFRCGASRGAGQPRLGPRLPAAVTRQAKASTTAARGSISPSPEAAALTRSSSSSRATRLQHWMPGYGEQEGTVPAAAQHSPVGEPVDQPRPDTTDSLIEPAELVCGPAGPWTGPVPGARPPAAGHLVASPRR